MRDSVVRQLQRSRVDPQIVFLAIDNATMNVSDNVFADDLAASPPLRKMAQKWPWARDVHADVLERLMKAGAHVVAFDILFPMPREGDAQLRAALDKYRDHVVIGSDFVDEQSAAATRALVQPSKSLIDDPEHDDRVGFANFWPDDIDEKIRSARYRVSDAQVLHTHGAREFYSLAARVLQKSGAAVPRGVRDLRFASAQDAGAFPPIPLYSIFVPEMWHANFADGTFFRDKIVLIGPHGNAQKDQLNTPFGMMDGPVLHLNAINEALCSDFITRPGRGAEAAQILVAGLAALALSILIGQPLWRLGSFIVLNAVYLGIVVLLYNKAGILPLIFSPLVALDAGGITALVWQQWAERRESKRVRRMFERFVSKNIVREVIENRASFLQQLGGARKCCAVLMSDLRGFTTLTENADSTQLVAQLNEYFTEMVKCVFSTNGTLDKFIGDAILAVWGNVHSEGNARDAELAVTTALRMLAALRELNVAWRARGWPELHMGLGINYGEVIFAALGSEEKAEPTVIGDPVNLASRLEGLTKEYGVEIIIGERMAELVRDKFLVQLADYVRVKGKTQPVKVYTVLCPIDANVDSALVTHLEHYEKALATYRAGNFFEACRLFHECADEKKDDPLARMYAERCAALHEKPPEENWDGVFVMHSK